MTSSRIAASPIVELALVCFGLGNLGLGGIEQTGRRCHHEPAGGQVDLRHDLPNERDEYVGAVCRIVAADSNKVVAWQVHHLRHRADGDTRRCQHREAYELLVVVILVVGGLRVLSLDEQPDSAPRLDATAVGDLGEADQETAPVRTDGPDGQRACGCRIGAEDRARSKPTSGIVGPNLDDRLTLDPVGAEDAADDELHQVPAPPIRGGDRPLAGRCGRRGPR
jgi:hypothetical protein